MTEDEISISKNIEEKYTPTSGNIKYCNSRMYKEFPKAKLYFESLFPNNYLDFAVLQDKEKLIQKNEDFKHLINNNETKESDIQRHIKENESYHIIGSILKNYPFGHHEAYLFPEFELGNSYRADYLILGKSSDGYQFIFVELENPYGKITKNDGDFGDVIRKGIAQIEDWKTWLESSYLSITESFRKETNKTLTDEFYKYDSSRLHYVIVAGRRADFKEKTYQLKRRRKKESIIELLHYDNLIDNSKDIVGELTY
jgi:hypothetical protein